MKGSKGQSQAGGESGKQLDQESGAGDSVLVSVHVELDFANEAWLLALSRTPTLPTALASSPSRTLTSLSLMTVPRTLLLNSWLQMPGNTLNLTFLTSHETTDLNWLLWHTGNRSPVLLQPGSRVSLTSHPGQVVLSIFNISHEWAASLLNTSGHQCLVLHILHCPAADTTYTCDLQSPGLTPRRVPVSVTIIQDGETPPAPRTPHVLPGMSPRLATLHRPHVP
ncbi:adhesion G-protein coupled receptor F3-like isoform X5 [Manis javanica]|uniref:adhesion G-protein coupled receptor F3-like isoform X5 n=1 Tax=Manis javanica TaxID=9974 RepID=UPI003C6D0D6C